MVGLCPASCSDITLIGTPTNCKYEVRRKTLCKLLLFPCSISLPSTIKGNIKPLFDDGTIVATSELGNFTVNEPQVEEISISACRPPKKLTTTREIVFQDKIAIEFTSGSPATTNKYWDYVLWKDKLNNEHMLSSMWVFDDGDVIIPRDANGILLPFTMSGFVNWEVLNSGSWVEFKQFSMVYQGDPFDFIAPEFNLIEEGISI